MRQIRKKIKSLGSLWVRLERPEGRKMLENALVPRASIDEIVGRRTQSLELFQQGYAMIRSAREMAGRAAPNGYLPTFPDNIKYMRSEEHTSELQSLMRISYAVFCLKKKKK